MSQTALTVPRAGDALIIGAFREIARRFGATNVAYQLLGGESNLEEPQDRALLDAIAERNSSVIYGATAYLPGLSVRYEQGKSGVFDQLHFSAHNGNGNKLSGEQRVELIAFLAEKFSVIDPTRKIGGSASEAQAELEALHNSILMRLQDAATTQLQKNSDHLQKLEADHVERRKQMEAVFEVRQKELDDRFASERRDLDERAKKLAERERELDNRTHTHARRAIRGDLKSELAKREKEFRLTRGTRRMRTPVHLVCMILLAGLGGLLIYTSWYTLNLLGSWSADSRSALVRPEFYYVISRQIILAMAFAGTAVAYVKWLNRWQQEHAEAEFELKRFQLDVDRASWIVETAFEWQSQVKKQMPSELLSAVCRNLFESPRRDDDQLMQPADELASALLGSAAKLKLQAGPAELEIDPKRLRKSKPIPIHTNGQDHAA
jgi:hypothetical protein